MTFYNMKIFLFVLIAYFTAIKSYSQVVVYGDSRTNKEIHQKIVNNFIKLNPVAVFNTGDLVFLSNSKNDWSDFLEVTKAIREKTSYFPVIGNHEKKSSKFYDYFKIPGNKKWYSVEIKDIVFISLNSNESLKPGSEQYMWLENNLKNISSKMNVVLLIHHPPFSSGSHKEDPKKLQKSIIQLIDKYNVSAVFSGHNHMYERLEKSGIVYVVTGGGGAPLHKSKHKSNYSKIVDICYNYCYLSEDTSDIKISAFNINNQIIDSILIKKK